MNVLQQPHAVACDEIYASHPSFLQLPARIKCLRQSFGVSAYYFTAAQFRGGCQLTEAFKLIIHF